MNNLNQFRTLAARIFAALLLAGASSASAAMRYVDVNSINATPPYTSWATAATIIQDAVDAALAGDEIVVANGVYATGGREDAFTTTNRVMVDKPLMLRSVNGPEFTIIDGAWSVRCVYLTDNASLSGFTLTNGVAGRPFTSPIVSGLGAGVRCAGRSAVVSNCLIAGNAAREFGKGGGAFGGTLNNCTLIGNTAYHDGMCRGDCSNGGGASQCILNNCTLAGNFAISGGGASGCTLNSCTLTGNYGGGARGGTLNNCTLSGNYGGGAYGEYVGDDGGGGGFVVPVILNNCIVYFNTPWNYGLSTLNYCCTTPLPTDGVGNITNSPLFVDPAAGNYRLRPDSPCIDAGTNLSASITNDLDGRPRPLDGNGDGLAAFDMGAYEYRTPLLVWQDSPNPTPPHADWATAAHTIQDAVDTALAGDEIVLTNGVYSTGGRDDSRVAVDKPLALRSVNGPQFTTIDGGHSNRCVYLTDRASLSGFTLTNGRAQSGGGLWCESTNAIVTNCVMSGNSTYGRSVPFCFPWCDAPAFSPAFGVSVYPAFAGGVYGGTLNNCILSDNRAETYVYIDDPSVPRPRYFPGYGGGAANSTLNNCTLKGNSAGYGGGAYGCILNNCPLTGNDADGANACTLNNCTLTGNSFGANYSTLNNCIVYFNEGANYGSSSVFNFCCTTPEPTNGVGNISLDPRLASASRLSSASPCRGAGNAAYVSRTDIDGEAWASPPSIGCDEYHAGALTGPLKVAITASFTTVRMGFTVQLKALIEGRTAASSWDFGDGTAATNQPYTSHAWTAVGDYVVVLRAYNESHPGGISATVIVHVVDGVHYVASDSTNPVAPYKSWATAATNIQDAIDAAIEPGPLVLVTNGIYTPIAAYKLLTVRSVNGPLFTVIDGGQSNRCVSLGSVASIFGFTLRNGFSSSGGGAAGGTLNNCTLSSNSASAQSYGGGGANGCTLNSCTLTGNSALGQFSYGGGAYGCMLNNCTLTGNSAVYGGGGASFSALNNCTLSGNSAGQAGGAQSSTLNNCTLTGNSANMYGGGGAAISTLNNCTLTGNSADGINAIGGGASFSTLNNCTLSGNSVRYAGGGTYQSTLNNCIVYSNTAPQGANYYSYSTLNYSCTTPLPTNGVGNITNAPLFVDLASGNLRLQSNSPCINAGGNTFAPVGPDLDGNPRIAGGTVDIGAYEFQSPTSSISYAWLQQFNLPIHPSTDTADPDGDRLNNWQEWRCGTDPTNALSALRLLALVTGGTNVLVTWQSVEGVNYFLERATNLAASPAFAPLATSIPGQIATTTYTDTNAVGAGPWFYRVGVIVWPQDQPCLGPSPGPEYQCVNGVWTETGHGRL